jgi:hypothetical protein
MLQLSFNNISSHRNPIGNDFRIRQSLYLKCPKNKREKSQNRQFDHEKTFGFSFLAPFEPESGICDRGSREPAGGQPNKKRQFSCFTLRELL